MENRLIIANWKSHGSQESVKNWCERVQANFPAGVSAELCICPPFPYIPLFKTLLQEASPNISLGAQNISAYSAGAYTGEVHADMLTDFGCRYVLVGHSERRALFKETHEALVAKVELALASQIIPVFCVGETQKDYESGKTVHIIEEQLAPIMKFFIPGKSCLPLIAYEPVWAIGTGLAATAQLAQETHAGIKKYIERSCNVSSRVLYGGSVKSANASGYITCPSIDGLLIGGASLDADEILKIYTTE